GDTFADGPKTRFLKQIDQGLNSEGQQVTRIIEYEKPDPNALPPVAEFAKEKSRSEVEELSDTESRIKTNLNQSFGTTAETQFIEQIENDEFRNELLKSGENSSQKVVEIKTYDKDFDDLTRVLKAHAWQLDKEGDGSVVRLRTEDVRTGKVSYLEQTALKEEEDEAVVARALTAEAGGQPGPAAVVAEEAGEIYHKEELLKAGETTEEQVVEVRAFDKAFNDPLAKVTSHAWQLDLNGDGSLVRIKSEEVATSKITYLEQKKDNSVKASLLKTGESTGEDVFEVKGFDAAFSEASQPLKSHAWQLDLNGDGSEIRMKNEDVGTGKISYVLQREDPTAERKTELLNIGETSDEKVIEVITSGVAFKDQITDLDGMEGHYWQLDLNGDGSEVRMKSEDPATGRASYILQKKSEDGAIRGGLLGAGESSEEDLMEITAWEQSFQTRLIGQVDPAGGTPRSHAWQLDLNGDGTVMRMRNEDPATGKITYIEQRQVDDEALKNELLRTGETSEERVIEVKSFDKSFDDAGAKITSHAWQLALSEELGAVRSKAMIFENDIETGKASYSEQRQVGAEDPVIAELGASAPEEVAEIKEFGDKAFNDSNQKMAGHAWQADLGQTNTRVRTRSQRINNGEPSDDFSFSEQERAEGEITKMTEFDTGFDGNKVLETYFYNGVRDFAYVYEAGAIKETIVYLYNRMDIGEYIYSLMTEEERSQVSAAELEQLNNLDIDSRPGRADDPARSGENAVREIRYTGETAAGALNDFRHESDLYPTFQNDKTDNTDLSPFDDAEITTHTYMDINGDGRLDYVRLLVEDYIIRVDYRLHNGTGFGAQKAWLYWDPAGASGTDYGLWKFAWTDINGDGKTDLVGYYNTSGGLKVQAFTKIDADFFGALAEVQSGQMTSSQTSSTAVQYFKDMNGDGRLDFVNRKTLPRLGSYVGDTYLYVALNTGSGFSPAERWEQKAGDFSTDWTHEFLDMDGDGDLDYVKRFKENTTEVTVGVKVFVSLNNGSGLGAQTEWGRIDSGNYNTWGQALQDMDGDGLPDLVMTWKDETDGGSVGTRVRVKLNTGSGFGASSDWDDTETGNFIPWAQQLIDMDKDNLPDLVQTYKGTDGTRVRVRINNGNGFDAARYWDSTTSGNYSSANWQQELTDMNGDGLPDHVRRWKGTDGTRVVVALNTGEGFGLSNYWDSTKGIDYSNSKWKQSLRDLDGDGVREHVMMYLDPGVRSKFKVQTAGRGANSPEAILAQVEGTILGSPLRDDLKAIVRDEYSSFKPNGKLWDAGHTNLAIAQTIDYNAESRPIRMETFNPDGSKTIVTPNLKDYIVFAGGDFADAVVSTQQPGQDPVVQGTFWINDDPNVAEEMIEGNYTNWTQNRYECGRKTGSPPDLQGTE
ncbi:MAG: VCBS repeat-containing protein, partial [Candidatus Omnitrophica bacterium]|nr:VCBS repeat-containing protein [Candidatus Omnitrophota bacterium]